jgi:hypothetical protein
MVSIGTSAYRRGFGADTGSGDLERIEIFDIADSAQFYRMVVADYDEFVAEQHSARRALHCAISAYHLHEWVWADWLKNNKAMQNHLKVHSRNEFLAWIMKHCVWFVWTRDLANGTKHCIQRLDFGTHFVAPPPLQLTESGSGQAEGAARQILIGPQGKGYLIIDNGAAEELNDEVDLMKRKMPWTSCMTRIAFYR